MLVGLPSPFVGFRRWKALFNTVAAARFPFLDEALYDTVFAFILYCPNIMYKALNSIIQPVCLFVCFKGGIEVRMSTMKPKLFGYTPK